jgi:hypothetical protein
LCFCCWIITIPKHENDGKSAAAATTTESKTKIGTEQLPKRLYVLCFFVPFYQSLVLRSTQHKTTTTSQPQTKITHPLLL